MTSNVNPILKKLQFKDAGQAVLVMNAPESYQDVIRSFSGKVDTKPIEENYHFVQVFGTSNGEIEMLAKDATNYVINDGLLWICYPKKSSKKYKGSDCNRDTVAPMLGDEGYESVRQVSIDEDWSAIRFRKAMNIKKMVRNWAASEEGKAKTGQGD